MSLAPSIPSIKVKVGAVSVAPPHRACRSFAVIRSSKAEGPIRRPAAPPLSPPPPKTPALSTPPTLSQPPTPVKPAVPPTSSLPTPPSPELKPVEAQAPAAALQRPVAGAVTLEYQRKVAKDLQEYFKKKKLEEADQGPFFGFLPKNEISNGRYVCPCKDVEIPKVIDLINFFIKLCNCFFLLLMGRTLQNFKHLVNRDTSMSGLELDPTFMDHISSKAARMSISCFSALNPLLYFPTLSLHHPSPQHLISSFLCLLPHPVHANVQNCD